MPSVRKPARRAGATPAPYAPHRKPRPPAAGSARPVKRAPKPKKKAAEPAPPRPLTPSQRRYLRGLAHDLKAVILVGQKGITPPLLAELEIALAHHELLKVKLGDDDREARAASIEAIIAHTGAELVQSIGKVASFFRRKPRDSQFELPR